MTIEKAGEIEWQKCLAASKLLLIHDSYGFEIPTSEYLLSEYPHLKPALIQYRLCTMAWEHCTGWSDQMLKKSFEQASEDRRTIKALFQEWTRKEWKDV